MFTVKRSKFVSSFSLILFITLSIIPQGIKSAIKCNLELMNEFGLSGMPISIHDPMDICGHVIDKCCTVSDEVRIYQYWNAYTKPTLARRVNDYLRYATSIIRMFYRLMELNPQLIVLKYVVKKPVPFEYEVCNSELTVEDDRESSKFLDYNDFLLEQEFSQQFYANKTNQGKPFNTTMYSHDKWGKRHFGVNVNDAQGAIYDKRANYTEVSITPVNTDAQKIICAKQSATYEKEFVIVNERKTKFCLSIYRNFLDFNNNYFDTFMVTIKNLLTQTVEVKGGVYCAICDAHSQRFFDTANKKIVISQDFCKAMLNDKRDLFMFMQVVMIEYMDSFLQYMECFETDAKIYTFPFHTMLVKYKRRIPLIKACFDGLESKEFMDKCWFICNKYSVFGFNWFFDSDVDVVRRIYLAIYSFLRKLDISKETMEREEEMKTENNESLMTDESENVDLLTNGNVNGMLIEPLNPSHALTDKYYLDTETRTEVLGKLNLAMRPKKIAKTAVLVNSLLANMGLPSLDELDKLKRECERLTREKQQLESDRDQLMKTGTIEQLNKVKKELQRLEAEREEARLILIGKKPDEKTSSNNNDEEEIKLGDAPSTKRPGISAINGLKDQLYEIKRQYEVHDGYRPKQNVILNRALYEDVAKVLVKFGFPNDIVANEIEKAKLKARKLQNYNTNNTQNFNPNNQGSSFNNNDPNNNNYNNNGFNNNSPNNNNYNNNGFNNNNQNHQYPNSRNDLTELASSFEATEGKIEFPSPQITTISVDPAEEKRLRTPRVIDPLMEDVEAASQFFERREGTYGIIDYPVDIQIEGLNFLKDYTLINYKFNVTALLEKKFKPEEKLTVDTIYTFLEHSAESINSFNFDIKSQVLSYREITDPTHVSLKKQFKKAQGVNDFKNASKLKKKIKRIESKQSVELKYKTDALIKRAEREKVQMLKGVAKHHKKVVSNDHIDQRHYKRNFGKIGDFFVSMFGP